MHNSDIRRNILREGKRRGKICNQAALLVSMAYSLEIADGNTIFFDKELCNVDVKRVPRFVKKIRHAVIRTHAGDQGVRNVVHGISVQMVFQRGTDLRGGFKVVPIVPAVSTSEH